MKPVNPLEQPRNQVHAEVLAAQDRFIKRLELEALNQQEPDKEETKEETQARNRERARARLAAKKTKRKRKRKRRKRRK